MTRVGKLDAKSKPVACIFNPASGRGIDIRPKIEKKLGEHGIAVVFYATQRVMHAWEMAEREIDFA